MPECYQVQVNVFGWQIGQEDCLRLSVYSPAPAPPVQLPVIVWIHGGGFVSGQAGSAFAGPGFLLDQDVILVTLHYRLGPLGFLSLGSEAVPGNAGLWDQRAALQWIRRNIAQFGLQHLHSWHGLALYYSANRSRS